MKEIKVSLMQPTFLSWQGLFEMINISDKFVFLNDYQLSIGSNHLRNILFTFSGDTGYYTVPIQKSKSFKKNINEALLVEDHTWKEKFLRRLISNYSKAKYFNTVMSMIEKWLMFDYKILADINIDFIKLVCTYLNIKKEFLYSSDFTKETCSTSTRSKRILEILNWAGATTYICANGSFDYMKEDKIFPDCEVEVLFQNFIPKQYPQVGSSEFVPYLSVLDLIFNVSPQEAVDIIMSGTDKWLNWNERSSLQP